MDPSKLKGILGLFRPKPTQEVNVGRRAIMGLPRQAEEMLPSVVTTTVTEEPPAVVGALQKVIEDKMAQPTSRREFMNEGVKAAASTALRRAAPGALRQVVKKVVEAPTVGPAADEAIAKAINDIMDRDLRVPKKLLNELGIDVGDFEDFRFRDLITELQDSAVYHDYHVDEGISALLGEKLAKAVGLTPEQIAKQAKLPVEVVKQYAEHPTTVLDSLVDIMPPNYENMELEGFDIYNETPLEKIWDTQMPVHVKKAMEIHGPDVDMDTLVNHLHENLRVPYARAYGQGSNANEHLSRSLESAMQREYQDTADELLYDALYHPDFQETIRDIMKGE